MQRVIEKNSIKRWLEELSKVQPKDRNAGLWSYVYKLTSEPRRRRIAVNLSKISRYAKEGENVVVPGKVLGSGSVGKGLNITAVEYSIDAVEKLRKANCKVLTLAEMMKKESVKVII